MNLPKHSLSKTGMYKFLLAQGQDKMCDLAHRKRAAAGLRKLLALDVNQGQAHAEPAAAL